MGFHCSHQLQKAGPETLKERLRDIKHPKGVKLLYDVLSFKPPEIQRAVLFVTNNALVCETPDDAMKVAYELDDGQQRSVHIK